MEILSARILLRPRDAAATTRFYRDQLRLAIAREYSGGTVFFAGSTLIEVAEHLTDDSSDGHRSSSFWLQVRDIAAAERDLTAAGVPIDGAARTEPWGLVEMHIHDPDGRQIILVEIPADHPLRRDTRGD